MNCRPFIMHAAAVKWFFISSDNVKSQLIIILDTNPVWWGHKPSSHTKAQQKVIFPCNNCLHYSFVRMFTGIFCKHWPEMDLFLYKFHYLDDFDRMPEFCNGFCPLSLNDEPFQQVGHYCCSLRPKVFMIQFLNF